MLLFLLLDPSIFFIKPLFLFLSHFLLDSLYQSLLFYAVLLSKCSIMIDPFINEILLSCVNLHIVHVIKFKPFIELMSFIKHSKFMFNHSFSVNFMLLEAILFELIILYLPSDSICFNLKHNILLQRFRVVERDKLYFRARNLKLLFILFKFLFNFSLGIVHVI